MTIEYQINLPEYLSKCINKDKPQFNCDGKCVLMVKIKEKEQNETEKNLIAHEYSSLYVHKEQTVFTICPLGEETQKNRPSPYLNNYRFQYNTTILRPPGSAA